MEEIQKIKKEAKKRIKIGIILIVAIIVFLSIFGYFLSSDYNNFSFSFAILGLLILIIISAFIIFKGILLIIEGIYTIKKNINLIK
jgi:hypothetical protein